MGFDKIGNAQAKPRLSSPSPIDTIMACCSLLAEELSSCDELGIAIIAFSPLHSGAVPAQ